MIEQLDSCIERFTSRYAGSERMVLVAVRCVDNSRRLLERSAVDADGSFTGREYISGAFSPILGSFACRERDCVIKNSF